MPSTRQLAPTAPIASILPLLGVAHLDRAFEYYIDSEQDKLVQAGVRVRIKFHGRLVDGIVLDRHGQAQHKGQLRWIERVISPEVVYPAQLKQLIDALTVRYGGITSDLIRLAIPARHGQAEKNHTCSDWEDHGQVTEPDLSPWMSYVYGSSFVDAVLAGKIARAAWQIRPGDDWAHTLAPLAVKVAKDGGGVLIVLPDQRDVDKLKEQLKRYVAAKHITELSASLGPQARYRRYLDIVHGHARIVVGTRSAAFAPLHNLRLVAIKDDGDDNLVDQRAPYVHSREVLSTRSSQQQCSFLAFSHTRTAEMQMLVESGWAHDLVADRTTIRSAMPHIHAAADSDYALERDPRAQSLRIPSIAFGAIKKSLDRGAPVLIQVPRKGYVPTLACASCRHGARCRHCNGPLGIIANTNPHKGLSIEGSSVPQCRWCGRFDNHFRCSQCGSARLRAVVLGTNRTAEEIGRAFPQVKVITSGGNKIVASIKAEPCIVVSTPGAEPEVDAGRYGVALLLDTWALLGRQQLRAAEDALAKWAYASSLVMAAAQGGEVIIVADPGLAHVQALIRWDMIGIAHRELAQRAEVCFPPVYAMAAIDGPVHVIDGFVKSLNLPDTVQILGPVDLPPGVKIPGADYDEAEYGQPQRILLRTIRDPQKPLGALLRAGLAARSAKKAQPIVRVQVDPIYIG
ncbi:primosomal protein N' [Corynebacterium sp. sy017]|uniref:primosomal protein N' n=1 Tax=unclassified Corynebacterium TaxID=2624378 RepID=UPI0011853040|nr:MULTISPECIES: primosomal protein N' [unclassified Corynebacterium]MBP3087679.1 primosomal protein N' [Corynebacterium sp. sy017]TSD92239.1 primosomal protein N' [Corynebacterium sp. SY003]